MAHLVCDTWGRVTNDEKRARRSMIHTLRLAFLRRYPFDGDSIRLASNEWEELLNTDMSLSNLYNILTNEQGISVREIVNNPAVRVIGADRTEWWVEAEHDLLSRLEGGEHVGPVDQKNLFRAPGTKVI